MIEIERKFLVTSTNFTTPNTIHTRIVQGYLNSHPERAVRIRIKGTSGYLTIKGKGNETGVSRFEWEKEIPLEEAEQLLALCEKGVIEKTRYEIPVDGHLFEVDVFEGANKGLIVAEIELQHENESFTIPSWLGNEVTGNPRYYNSQLSLHPYNQWK